MSSAFHGISVASTALRAFQQALEVTGHNIANVNTPGYSRQKVDLNANMATPEYGANGVYMMGNGVSLTSVNRIRDQFLEARRASAGSDLAKFDSQSTALTGVNSLVLEPGGAGVSEALDKFFNSWSALGSNPNDAGARLGVQQAGLALTTRVRSLYSNLSDNLTQANAQVVQGITDLNTTAGQIANLNKEITSASASGVGANDLMDQRDQLVRNLNGLADVFVSRTNNGSVNVSLGGYSLVDTAGSHPLPTTYDPTQSALTNGGTSYPVKSGTLAGLFNTINTIKGYQGSLDSLANNLRTQVNSVHATGINSLGNTGVSFFKDTTPPAPQNGAIDFDLGAAVKADPRAIAAGVSANPGDGGLALSLSKMRDQPIAGLGNLTFNASYTSLVGAIGRDAASVKDSFSAQSAVVSQIDNQVQSVSGVSLDDEMSSMLQYQRSYQAAAKALSVMDQTTDDLINLLHR